MQILIDWFIEMPSIYRRCLFDPEEIKASIQKIIPDFEMDYDVDPVRQSIAESWPNSLDVSCAQEEWGFSPKYDLDVMTKDMLEN